MGLELRLSQKLEQNISMQQRLEIRQQLAQRMGDDISSLRSDAGGDDEVFLDDILKELLENIQNAEVKEALLELFNDENLRRKLLERVELLAIPSDKRIGDFALDYFYESFDGAFMFEPQDKKGVQKIGNVYKIVRHHFDLAYKNPEKLDYEIDKLEEIVKRGRESGVIADTQRTIEEIRNMREAKLVMAAARESIDILKDAVKLSLLKNGKNGEQSILANFLRDTAILRRLDFVISERIQKRFISRFSKTLKGVPVNYEDAFLNTVGEYSLASIGIIDPEVFRLQRAEIDPFLYRDVKATLDEMGLSYDELAKHYNLKGSGTIFWNRWAIKGQKPSSITDDKIREFLTQTVRKDKEKILKGANYVDFFEEIKGVLKRTSGKSEYANRENELRELLVNKFEDKNFRNILLDLIKNNWYSKLDIFMNVDKK